VRRVCWLLALACASPALGHEGGDEAPAAPPAAHRYEPPAPGSYELPPIQTLERHSLLGSDGAETELLDVQPGQVALVSLVYLSCPHQCPMTHAVFQKIDRSLAEDAELTGRVELVTVSFDPERDTPERMATLRRQLAPRSDWRFLTARDAPSLAPVLADFGQDARAADGVAAGRIDHVLKVFLVDGEQRVRNVYSAEFLDSRLLLNDARTVLREARSTARP
jgi:cytochrome oxidase Cu insertion factor (SCO1/SenC/PrrC family)